MTSTPNRSALSPLAPTFYPSVSPKKKMSFDIEYALSLTSSMLSVFDFSLLSAIVKEWYSFPTLTSCFSSWKEYECPLSPMLMPKFNVLLFNVRGLADRWPEVLVFFEKYKADCLVLVEIGAIEWSLIQKVFAKFTFFYQKGENAWGGVLIVVRPGICCSRIKCDIPNICVVDIKLEETVRILGVYAPKSKTWKWDDLSQFSSNSCCILGDFNIDLDDRKDEKAAKDLLQWSDSLGLTPVIPSVSTSLRSERTIDYAFSCGVPLTLQVCEDSTTSDHKPALAVFSCERKENMLGANIRWKVFNFFMSLVTEFWDLQWKFANTEECYSNFVTFLRLLKARCTRYFPLRKYRITIPFELRRKLSIARA